MNSPKRTTKIFDIIWDTTLQRLLEWLENYNLQMVSFKSGGTESGNPCVELEGTEEDIAAFNKLLNDC
jgi:hypothetical protein